MIANGRAAFFPIYPSLPGDADFNRMLAAAEHAWDHQLGQWDEFGTNLLLGYEYRSCIKLAAEDGSTAAALIGEAFQRICVDLRNKKMLGKFALADVPPPYRLWIWEKDIAQAKQDLGLVD
jgi:hypothetical protein